MACRHYVTTSLDLANEFRSILIVHRTCMFAERYHLMEIASLLASLGLSRHVCLSLLT